MANTTVFMPIQHKVTVAPDFSGVALCDEAPLGEAVDHVLRAKGREVMPAERERLEEAVAAALGGALHVGALRQLEDGAWKRMRVPLLFRVYLRALVEQTVRLSKRQLLECDFNNGQPIDWKRVQRNVPHLEALGFQQDEALEALVVTGNKQVELAAHYLLADKKSRLRDREHLRRRVGKHVPPTHHHSIVQKARERQQIKDKLKRMSTHDLEQRLAAMKRQLAREKQMTAELERRRDEAAHERRLQLYQDFLSGLIAKGTLNAAAVQALEERRQHLGLSTDHHDAVLGVMGLTARAIDDMKCFDGEEDGDIECLVCYERPKSVVVMPCFHLCFCPKCADEYRETHGDDATCPMCDKPATQLKNIFYG